MFRVRGCSFRALLALAMLGATIVGGGAQESAEVKEDLGNSYMLARRTTSQGSIIETLLYAGRAIVTDLVMPPSAANAGSTAGARPGFAGSALSAEVSDGYLILHRIRTGAPVTHEIFRDGEKVGAVTEAAPATGSKAPGRNLFAFEATDGRFVVHLTQPDGTKIHAAWQHGQLSDQVVEPAAAAPRSATAEGSPPLPAPVRYSVGPTPELPRSLANPRDTVGSIGSDKEGAPAIIASPPLPRAAPTTRLVSRPRMLARPQSAPPVAAPVRGLFGGAPASTAVAPLANPAPGSTPAVAKVNNRVQRIAAARPVGQAARPSRPPAAAASTPQAAR
jgi:hypothetical protein